MKERIVELAQRMQRELVAFRRDLHRHPEVGWTEFRTASMVAKHLDDLGYEVFAGEEVIEKSAMMGVPSEEVLLKHMERARQQGAPAKYLGKMNGGKTGVMGKLETGRPGPVIALRFEMDANDLNESKEEGHRPFREGFSSVNELAMHACGHDGHVAMGVGIAELLIQCRDQLGGTVKLIFQPAEEGARGASSMVAKGIVDDVDYMLGLHLGFSLNKSGQLLCGSSGLLATSKFDAMFKGIPAHAGARPEDGKSALLAAASAAMSLQGINRHSQGASRINIGVLKAGTGRNVVPDCAVMQIETRGATSEIDGFVKNEAVRMINANAAIYDVQVSIKEMGGAASAESDPEMIALVEEIGRNSGMFDDIRDTEHLGFSEDYSCFMNSVKKNGGKANYFMVGTTLAAGHHDSRFDFDEDVLADGVALLGLIVHRLADSFGRAAP